jgi:hypothetical protein
MAAVMPSAAQVNQEVLEQAFARGYAFEKQNEFSGSR